ncbi:MAG: hypothetical protein PHE89_06375 [Alphaproteobacteria bacterium]|nr:hypothetical protein [Alphaproteobacteria bacterium]
MRKIIFSLFLLVCLFSFEALAMVPPKILPYPSTASSSFTPEADSLKPFPEQDLPKGLQTWAKWVLDGEKKQACDFAYNDFAQKYCYYISNLDIEIVNDSASFEMNVTTREKGYVRLPGSAEVFPQQVFVNGTAKNIISKAGIPYIHLGQGEFVVKGMAKSKENIRYLFIPQNAALINLKKDGKTIDYITLDNDGVLKFEGIETAKNETDDLSVFAYRKIQDGIPLMMTLNLNLNVTGKERIENLGKVIPENFALYSIASDVSAYVQKNGDLIVEVKPGNLSINLEMRQEKDSLNFVLNNSPVNQEVWVLESDKALRVIQAPKDLYSVQTQNIPMPVAWKRLPAYEVNKGEEVALKAIYYDKQNQDSLTLNRKIKLAFDGSSYSLEDNISADFKEDGRLSLERPFVFYSSKINGQPQAITYTSEDKNAGIEVRKGNVSVENILRIANGGKKISATGYNRSFENVNWVLSLAPGYKLLYASGFDNVNGSWVSHWNLLQVFIVSLLVVSMYSLFGWKKAGLGLILFVLINPIFPQFIYASFVLCGLLFLQRNLKKDNNFYNLLTFLRYSLFALLVASTFFFIVQHIRGAMYPVLSADTYYSPLLSLSFLIGFYAVLLVLYVMYHIALNPKSSKTQKTLSVIGVFILALCAVSIIKAVLGGFYLIGTSASRMNYAVSDYAESSYDSPVFEVASSRKMMKASYGALGVSQALVPQKVDSKYQSIDVAKNIAQTGIGFPNWRGGKDVSLSIKGPVSSNDFVRIYLLSPLVNLCLALLSVCLSVLTLYWLLDFKYTKPNVSAKGKNFMRKIFTASLFTFMLFGASSKVNASEVSPVAKVPTPEILQEMKGKLAREKIPSCLPDCVSIPKAEISNDENLLKISYEVHSDADLVLPLPSLMPDGSGYLKLKAISIDGGVTKNLVKENNQVYAFFKKGINKVEMTYLLDANSDRFILSSVVRIGYMESRLSGLAISENKSQVQSFQINRTVIKAVTSEEVSTKSKMNIDTFFKVQRVFRINTTWQLETIITRSNNLSEAVTFEIELMPMEKVLSPVEILPNNKVRVSFAPSEAYKSFTSLLPVEEDIVLSAAPEGGNYNEEWSFDVDYSWSFKFSGINPIVSSAKSLVFKPRAGETLTMDFFKPNNVDGYILTFDKVTYELSQGRGSMDVFMRLNFRASDSGVHSIVLPNDFEVTEVLVGGVSYPITVNENKLTLPVIQGQNNVDFKGTMKKPIGVIMSFPKFDLNAPAVNIEQFASVPLSRWVLFVSGPVKGPVVLFWSTVAAWILFSLLLSRVKIIPLGFVSWFILLIGLTQVNSIFSLVVITWFVALGLRDAFSEQLSGKKLIQIIIPCLTFIFVFSLFKGIYNGLLGHWNMKIVGDSVQAAASYVKLGWYQDAVMGELPSPKVFSLPVWVYRLVMVVWATWLSISFVKWMKWGFKAYTKDENWISK